MSGLSGWAQGLEKGLESLVRFQGIKEQRDRADRTEARQSVIQGREDTAYAEANETAPFKTGMPGGQPVQDYLVGFGSTFGFIDKDGNIKRKDRMPFQKAFNDDVHAQHDILQIQSRELTREIGELQKSLGGRGPSDDLTGVTENINRQLQEKIEKKTNLDNTNKAFLEALKQKNKEREFGLSEEKAVRDAKKAEGEEARAKSKEEREAKKPLADKYEEVIVLRDQYPKDSKEWKQYDTSAQTIMKYQKELHVSTKTATDHFIEREAARDRRDAVKQDLATLDKAHTEELKDLDTQIKEAENEEDGKFLRVRRQARVRDYRKERNDIIKGGNEAAAPPGFVDTGKTSGGKKVYVKGNQAWLAP